MEGATQLYAIAIGSNRPHGRHGRPPQVVEKARLTPVPATEGETLKQQVRAKLKRRFDAAAAPDGTLTASQARSAGLGAIADQFGTIDRAGRGAIRFEDYERFLELRR